MKYKVISNAEFTYPDIWDYPSQAESADIFTCRGGYASFQLLFDELDSEEVSVNFKGLPNDVMPEIYTLVPVFVERNEGINKEKIGPHYPERTAPYYLYDCLKPFSGKLDLSKGFGGLYIAIKAEKNSSKGEYNCSLEINDLSIPVNLTVYPVDLPEETLTMINGYAGWTAAGYHKVKYLSEEYFEIEKKYLKALRRMHQNMMYVRGVKATKVSENKWDFDFSHMISEMKRYDEAGIKYFNGPSVGWRKSWNESTILLNGSIPSMSYEGYCYLSQYLPALKKVLEENNFLHRFVMGVADEPNKENATEFRALCGLIRKIVPEIRLIDAMNYGDLHGALDIWVPLNAEYDKHQEEIETMRANGDEIWFYVCCGPRERGYINRFMHYPLLSTRYLHWGNYRHNLTGYLHWAANCYQPNQDPFTVNCPEHHFDDRVCFLPPGDTHIIYPGTDGPWISIRLEAQRESAEEYELLKKLAETDKEKADEICEKVFRSFKDVEYDVNKFINNKRELLIALSE
ncbi:MAG: DUF4091 domain-containing protein [Ruminococcaceae bacterium]|nr:DUF4091 domain-containing protein [Oscillospiraceae bacterium]